MCIINYGIHAPFTRKKIMIVISFLFRLKIEQLLRSVPSIPSRPAGLGILGLDVVS